MDALLEAFARHFILPMRRYRLRIPQNRYDLVNLLHTEGTVIDEQYEADAIAIEADFPVRFHHQIEAFIVE
jgi:50S ribosomal subunit-associated GTPase HflX